MSWVCPFDHPRLTRRPDGPGLVCPACAREFRVVDDIPLFDPASHHPPASPELDQSCTPRSFTTDLGFFLPAGCDGAILELGARLGDDTLRLAARARRVVRLVPSLPAAQIVSARLRAESCGNVELAAVRSLAHLPIESGSLDAVVVDEAALSGFGLTRDTLPAAAAEWSRVLRRDGALVCGLRGSPLGRWAMLRLRTAGRPGGRAGRTPRARLGYARSLRVFRSAGFGVPSVHAPLPNENDIAIVLPLRQRHVIDYGLEQMLRSNSLIARTAIAAARIADRLGALEHLAPYYFVVLRRAGS